MSNEPPKDDKYSKAVEAQKSGVKQSGKYRYTFRGNRKDGIQSIFNATGEDVMDATSKAVQICKENDWEYQGRVVENKSAYDRARKEGN